VEQLLDLSPTERRARLASLRAEDVSLALMLETQLARHARLAASRFLELPLHAHARGLGRYQLREPLGRGGSGSVWLAERIDRRVAELVAIKLPHSAFAGSADDLRREGKLLASLRHHAIASLIDVGLGAARQPFLVLEYVDGQRIDEYCRARRASVGECLQLFLDLLEALSHAHARAIVHCDIKPANVLVRSDGRVKLLDFGAAARRRARARRPITPSCAAPEQLALGRVSAATDVYAAGVLLYKLLTGEHPAGAPETLAQLLRATLEASPALMSERVNDPIRSRQLQGGLDTIVARALDKVASKRFKNARTFAAAIREHIRVAHLA
jgi:serine/threonine protein kinase